MEAREELIEKYTQIMWFTNIRSERGHAKAVAAKATVDNLNDNVDESYWLSYLEDMQTLSDINPGKVYYEYLLQYSLEFWNDVKKVLYAKE